MLERTQATMKQTLLLIRHGQTSWNVEHRLPGQIPGVELNETGRQQAARLADALTVIPISAIISSPLERAYETAKIIAQHYKLEIQFEPDLMDIDLGHWTGQSIDKTSKNDPAWKAFVKDPTVGPDGVETFPQVEERAVAAVERWRKLNSIGAYPAFIAHADVIKLLIAHYTGLEARRAGSFLIDNASVSLINWIPIIILEFSQLAGIPNPVGSSYPLLMQRNKVQKAMYRTNKRHRDSLITLKGNKACLIHVIRMNATGGTIIRDGRSELLK